MFSLEGELLNGKESFDWLVESIRVSRPDVRLDIGSAFIKSPIFAEIVACAGSRTGRVLVRWQKFDLSSGASDLEVFEIATNSGWEIYVDLRFHGKIYAIEDVGILIGSANATRAGFSHGFDGNKEFCTVVKPTRRSLTVIEQVFDSAVKIDADIFANLRNELSFAHEDTKSSVLGDWSAEILSKLEKTTKRGLFVADFFQKPYSQSDIEIASGDLELLSLNSAEFDLQEIRERLLKLQVTQELLNLCELNPKGVWFGAITAHFHDLLLDNPSPYRSDVKQLVENLLSWVGAFLDQTFELSRPSHSLRVRLKKYVT